MWSVVGGVVAILALFTFIVYNAKQSADAESSASAEEAARKVAVARVDSLEAQRAADEAAVAKKDADEGTQVVASGSGARGTGFLRDSFPKDRNDTN